MAGCRYLRYVITLKMTSSRRVPGGRITLTTRMYISIKEHHKHCLKALFFEYYEPLPDGNHDRLWVTRLQPSVKNQVRLHLGVLRGGDIFDWTDEEIGTKIIYTINNLIT